MLSLADGLSWRGGETLRITLARGSLIGATGGLIERASFSATTALSAGDNLTCGGRSAGLELEADRMCGGLPFA